MELVWSIHHGLSGGDWWVGLADIKVIILKIGVQKGG
jgi:hypothetical protein